MTDNGPSRTQIMEQSVCSDSINWPNKVKVLQFVTLFAIGGTERQVINLVRRLSPNRFDLHLACLRRWGLFLQELEAHRLPIVEYPVHSLYPHKAFKAQLAFTRHLKRQRFHVVHTYGFYPNVFAIPAARLAGVPVIVASLRDMGEMWTAMQRFVERLICRLADRIVVNAEAIKRQLVAEGCDEHRVMVIHNGIDPAQFFRNGNPHSLRHELGLPAQAPLVGVLCRLIRLKGLEYFISAAAEVAARIPDVRFVIVGDSQCDDSGAYRRELEQQARRLGLDHRLLFTGFRLDTPHILSELAVSVLPSLSEGLSNVLLESMAAGVPVVATDVGGNPEAVEDGVTGLLVPPRDSESLAEAVLWFLRNPEAARRFGQAGRHRVLERFSIDRMVRATEHLYLSLLERRRYRSVRERPSLAGHNLA